MNKLFKLLYKLVVICLVISFVIVVYVRVTTNDKIIDNINDIEEKYSIAVILGAGVYGDRPSDMLRDRLDAGIKIYKENKVEKLLMTGDGIDEYYDEVSVMKNYAIDNGVSPKDIIEDKYGLNTSKSIINLKKLDANNVIIVSQKFHLNRALYLAQKYDIESIAYPAEDKNYGSLFYLYIRDIIASIKDFFS